MKDQKFTGRVCCFCQDSILKNEKFTKLNFIGLSFIAHVKCIEMELAKQKEIKDKYSLQIIKKD